MGNYGSHEGMEDIDELEYEVNFENELQFDFDDRLSYRENVENTLERMVSSIIGVYPRQSTTKMPVIRKKPDLTRFLKSQLYDEIKMHSGIKPTSKTPSAKGISLHKNLLRRENGIGSLRGGGFTENEHRRIGNLYIPNHKEEKLMSLESKVFISKLNNDGSRLVTASQDNIIRVFDASKGTYHRINRITAQDASWSILDVDFSPCGKYFAYSTWSNYFIVIPLANNDEDFKWFHLATENNRMCVFSIRFSSCGTYLLGGSNDTCVYITDRNTGTAKKIKTDTNHKDINAISYIDDSPNTFVSGSDDGVIQLWDQRCLGPRSKSEGVFIGHFDGVTYIDSRNDGRHILSNSKDQSIKIWDLRKMLPPGKKYSEATRGSLAYSWDYRWDNVPREFYNPHRPLDGDTSIMTYRGHRVTKSLIRAKFSPLEQTGQRYIYTGCGTGRVIIYDVLTGHIQEAIEGHKDIVRDVSWHPVRSEIVSSSWDSHVNLNKFKRGNASKRRVFSDDDRPLRRSRRIALRTQDPDEDQSPEDND